jgi:hypothetical protein
MKRTPAPDASGRSPEIAGEVYALDRRLPFGERINGLARFRGGRWTATRWLTNSAAPCLTKLAVRSWRGRPADVLASQRPFLLCLTREDLREGLRLLLGEWMEFRRQSSAALDLVLRTCLPESARSTFEFVAQYWEQVQALKRQLGVRRAGVYLWLRDEDDAGDELLLDAARALVVVARGQSFADPLTLALRNQKPVIAPHCDELPAGYPFTFATRPAVLRFLGEPRRYDTSSQPWPIPEGFELAKAIGRLAEADDVGLEPAIRRLNGRAALSPSPRYSGERGRG